MTGGILLVSALTWIRGSVNSSMPREKIQLSRVLSLYFLALNFSIYIPLLSFLALVFLLCFFFLLLILTRVLLVC
jgi:hypothetical protein